MRIIVAGSLSWDCDAETCTQILRDGADFIADSRKEEGCIAYDWAVDPLIPGRINVFEEWADEKALLRHFRDPSYAAMGANLLKRPLSGFAVNIYTVSGAIPVYDEDGNARTEINGVTLD